MTNVDMFFPLVDKWSIRVIAVRSYDNVNDAVLFDQHKKWPLTLKNNVDKQKDFLNSYLSCWKLNNDIDWYGFVLLRSIPIFTG